MTCVSIRWFYGFAFAVSGNGEVSECIYITHSTDSAPCKSNPFEQLLITITNLSLIVFIVREMMAFFIQLSL